MFHITGANGMLGRAVVDYCKQTGIPYRAYGHGDMDIADAYSVANALSHGNAKRGEIIINCAGIREQASPGPVEMVRVNSLGPHVLASLAEISGMRLWHISTDCVFGSRDDRSHSRGTHTASEVPAPDTLYGRTKLAGEPTGRHVVVIRTSFVGPDHGLWRWIAEQPKDALIEGWAKAFWSGSTVWEVAERLFDIPVHANGIIHLATRWPITKYEACKQIASFIGRDDIQISPSQRSVDRGLSPTMEIASLERSLKLGRAVWIA